MLYLKRFVAYMTYAVTIFGLVEQIFRILANALQAVYDLGKEQDE